MIIVAFSSWWNALLCLDYRTAKQNGLSDFIMFDEDIYFNETS